MKNARRLKKEIKSSCGKKARPNTQSKRNKKYSVRCRCRSAPPRLSPRRRLTVRSAHYARTLALLVRSPARPGRARGLCCVAVALLSARSLWSHGLFVVSLTLRFQRPKRCFSSQLKNHMDLLYHSY